MMADATGRTDEEVALALTVGAATLGIATAVLSVLHLLNYLEELDVYVVGPSRKS